jgi:hypothetical protein
MSAEIPASVSQFSHGGTGPFPIFRPLMQDVRLVTRPTPSRFVCYLINYYSFPY